MRTDTRWRGTLLSPSFLLSLLAWAAATPAQGQLSDGFSSHFGASRTYEPGVRWSATLGVMLLTQFDSRWVDDGTTYREFDDLHTTVGYNFGRAGLSRGWPFFALGGTPVASLALTVGITSDTLTKLGQNGLHDFRRFPHVQRPNVDEGDALFGLEGELMYWWGWSWWVFRFDAHPHVAALLSTYHSEASAGVAGGMGFWKLRAQASASWGRLYRQSQTVPAAVGTRLKDGYHRWDVSLAFDRPRLGSLALYIPTAGIAFSRSSGIFHSRSEKLLSVFVDFPSVSNDSFRLEMVNDLLGKKDSGPTGGLRLTYVAR